MEILLIVFNYLGLFVFAISGAAAIASPARNPVRPTRSDRSRQLPALFPIPDAIFALNPFVTQPPCIVTPASILRALR